MSDTNEMMTTWDLGDFLADRQMPTTTVVVYLNEYASHAKAQLLKAHSRASKEEVAELDKKLAEVDKTLEDSRYEIHLTAIPGEMRDDIHRKVLKDFPMKRNFLGQPAEDDPTQERILAENLLLWEACIRKMVAPGGKEFENPAKGDVELLDKKLPMAAKNAIDRAIRELHEDAERFTAEVKSQDF